MFDPSSFVNPTPLAHADASRDVLPRGGTSHGIVVNDADCGTVGSGFESWVRFHCLTSCQWSCQVPLILIEQKDLHHLYKVSKSSGSLKDIIRCKNLTRHLHRSPTRARRFGSQRFNGF
ncbi:hypothetical protein TNCV_4502291 [Trichonephila clavipes]|nr:hypothetical protein TNCV_4502291 [Trichonephila clavipes]